MSESDVKPDEEKIQVQVVYEGRGIKFMLKKSAPIRKVLDAFAKQINMDRKNLRFTHDGDPVRGDEGETPKSLGMEEGDEIQAHVEQIGGNNY